VKCINFSNIVNLRISEIIQPNLMRKCNYSSKFIQFDCDKQVKKSQEVIVCFKTTSFSIISFDECN